jgi:aminoglycoside phosphotransferase (APT) family kinase protein
MNKDTLPYLNSLKSLLVSILNPEIDNEDASMRIHLSKRLVDLLIVQVQAPPLFKDDFAEKLPKIAMKLEKLLPESKKNKLLLQKLKKICDLKTPNAYDQFLEISGIFQRQLIQLNTVKALNLSKLLLGVEKDYSQQILESIHDQNNLIKNNHESSSARNTRTFNNDDMIAFILDQFPKEKEVIITNTSFVAGGYSKFTADISLAKTTSLPNNMILRGDADGAFGGMSVVDEYQLIESVYKNGVCAPKPLAIAKNDTVFGSPFMLMEKMPGTCIGHMYDIPSIRSDSLVKDIAKKLSSIHSIPLQMLNKKTNGMGCLSSEKALSLISTSESSWLPLHIYSPAFSAAFEWLRHNVKLYDVGPRSLVHGDYGLNNLLIKGEQVTGILDWEHAHVGNPSYDLGYFHPMADTLASWSLFLDAYSDTGVHMPDENQINYSILLGATRVGVMVCQVRSAFLKNQETGIAASIGIAGDYYDVAITRISNALEKVL